MLPLSGSHIMGSSNQCWTHEVTGHPFMSHDRLIPAERSEDVDLLSSQSTHVNLSVNSASLISKWYLAERIQCARVYYYITP